MKKIVLALITAGLFVGVMAKDNSQHMERGNLTPPEAEVVHYDNREVNQTELKVEKTDKRPIHKKVKEQRVRDSDDKK